VPEVERKAIEVQNLRKGVIGFESEAVGGALGKRDIPRMVTAVPT